jgi:hypothetical protein
MYNDCHATPWVHGPGTSKLAPTASEDGYAITITSSLTDQALQRTASNVVQREPQNACRRDCDIDAVFLWNQSGSKQADTKIQTCTVRLN